MAITLGDPAGVGPEVALRAAADLQARPRAPRILLVGDAGCARATAERIGLRVEIAACTAGELSAGAPSSAGRGRFALVAPGPRRPLPPLAAAERRPGRPTIAGARVAFESIRTATALALGGAVDAICTAPISKEWFDRAGVARTGHTEILARLARARGVRLMMALDDLRVVLATSHLALRDVPRALTTPLVLDTITATARHLGEWWSIRRPRVAVAALNPHAGDGGVYGDEEPRIIAPAIRRARAAGIDAIGPVPADALFSAMGPRCDGIVAMYHDQGLIPIKQADVHRAVNVTLGLPFIRTSPDHGTAFDIAGRRSADPRSMASALALALDLARRSRHRARGGADR